VIRFGSVDSFEGWFSAFGVLGMAQLVTALAHGGPCSRRYMVRTEAT
jgi:hypothetical protein